MIYLYVLSNKYCSLSQLSCYLLWIHMNMFLYGCIFQFNSLIFYSCTQGMMDNVKGKMCSLPVVVSTALCSYINLLEDEARRKPLNILQQLMKMVPHDPNNQYYAERWLTFCYFVFLIMKQFLKATLSYTMKYARFPMLNHISITVCHKLKFHHLIEDYSIYSNCKIKICSEYQ